LGLFLERNAAQTVFCLMFGFFTMTHLPQNRRRGRGPDERFSMAVVVRDVFFDGANQVRQAAECAPANPLSRDVREPAFNEVKPRGAGRNKVAMVPTMRGKPLFNFGMRMGTVVV